MNTPVLLLIFNRPDTTKIVFEQIRAAKPARLFVSADGPRPGLADDHAHCTAARSVIKEIDWDCKLETLFHDRNIGCKRAVSSAIDWFFAHVEEGIILEDDCVPDQSFFRYCQELLGHFRQDTRVMQVCGSNLVGNRDVQDSYFFSRFGPVWGWASWRRAWQYYDVNMKLWPTIRDGNMVGAFTDSAEETRWRMRLYDQVYRQEIDTWDYQWGFAKLVQSGLSVIPRENLITNIGFHRSATHTRKTPSYMTDLRRSELEFPLHHPAAVLRHAGLDSRYFRKVVHGGGLKALLSRIFESPAR